MRWLTSFLYTRRSLSITLHCLCRRLSSQSTVGETRAKDSEGIGTASHPQNLGILVPSGSCKLQLYCSPSPDTLWDSISVPVSPSQTDLRYFPNPSWLEDAPGRPSGLWHLGLEEVAFS